MLPGLRYRGLEFLPILLAQRLQQPAAGHDAGGKAAPRLDPLPGHVEVLQAGQSLAHGPHHGVRVLRCDQPTLEAALPVAGVALEGQRRRNVHHLHLLGNAGETLV